MPSHIHKHRPPALLYTGPLRSGGFVPSTHKVGSVSLDSPYTDKINYLEPPSASHQPWTDKIQSEKAEIFLIVF